MRRLYLTKRRALSPEQRADASHRIQQAVIDSTEFQAAGSLALYVPIHNEVDTKEIMQKAWEMKKIVGLPHWEPQSGIIRFYRTDPATRLRPTDWGTQEPVPATTKELAAQALDLMLVPGIAFDSHGFRLGYGQGGYDRLLAGYSGKAWGLAFELQLIDSLPHESHDIPCSRIITEQRQLEVL